MIFVALKWQTLSIGNTLSWFFLGGIHLVMLKALGLVSGAEVCQMFLFLCRVCPLEKVVEPKLFLTLVFKRGLGDRIKGKLSLGD